MIFEKELAFEKALIRVLKKHGWNDAGGVLRYPTEQDLIDNWATILFQNNSDIDRLNDCPLTQGEMEQIIEQIQTLRTPLALNGFINGKTVSIRRDNPNDALHFGKEVSLKIYDRQEIAAGQSRYQIAQQPNFGKKNKMLPDRRGDLCLLINGMPVIHIELKRSGVPLSQACEQIKKYAHEGVFTGLFSLVQIFVAMTPEESVYFANPGAGEFNKSYYFHWADFNNEPINDWKSVASKLLSIPMAHQLIGFYTVADSSDGCLKVMRSYQYYAASAISDKVRKCKWKEPLPAGARGRLGGFVWHTTGSGKTMTSFKSAQLIADSKDADKVVFLMDRIELGTQSLKEYRAFASDDEDVQSTENSQVLKAKLTSVDPKDTLIVTSIQKLSRLKPSEGNITQNELDGLARRRIVFILDECHRSTFGDMLRDIRTNFPNALFFGFTGTPIHDENQKKGATTAMIFGDELHRYSIADGIRDHNVLGFDPYKVLTFRDAKLREAVALEKAQAGSVDEVYEDPQKEKTFYYYMDTSKIGMVGEFDSAGTYHKGIEDFVPNVQYSPTTDHEDAVVSDILDQFPILSHGKKFHAIFATSSIDEAISYYRLLNERAPELKVTALFDSSIDNNPGASAKEDALVEIISDYNAAYGKEFTISTWPAMKKDIAARLAHKSPYGSIDANRKERIDILIVVDQMLTGFDSKWVNTLYLDKVLEYENIIQAFSRTNRLFGPEKPFGVIRYYRRPHTMEAKIKDAVKLYSGDKPLALFVQKLPDNIDAMNERYNATEALFSVQGVENFANLPEPVEARRKFAQDFKELNEFLEAAYVQGFSWGQLIYQFEDADGDTFEVICKFDERKYLTLVQRYKELFDREPNGEGPDDVPYDLDSHLTEISTGHIDTDYMNANFVKWLKALDTEDKSQITKELHRSFASLSQDEQRFAELFLHDVERGEVELDTSLTLRDYITRYAHAAKNRQVVKLVEALGVDEELLEEMMALDLTDQNIDEYGRFEKLKSTIDKQQSKRYFEEQEGRELRMFEVSVKAAKLLKDFILQGGYDI
jgi:type I restriction enzyme R subunit